MEEDWTKWCPRKRWAEINNEATYTVLHQRTKSYKPVTHITPRTSAQLFLRSKHGQVWTYLYEPRTPLEIAEYVKIDLDLIKYVVDELKTIYGAKIENEMRGKKKTYVIHDRKLKSLRLG